MSDNTIVFDPTKQKHFEESASVTHATQNGPPNNSVDAIVLAFYYLMEASNATAQSAIVHSKQLNQNAVAQQNLNNKAAQLQWCYVPELQVDKHSLRKTNTHWTIEFWKHGGFEYVTYQTLKWTTNANGGLVNNAEAQNQQVIAERETIANRLNALQQNAQIGETNVNTFTDASMQTMQETQNVMQILQSLTFQALMRQPPQ
jgi:hypothetical protein